MRSRWYPALASNRIDATVQSWPRQAAAWRLPLACSPDAPRTKPHTKNSVPSCIEWDREIRKSHTEADCLSRSFLSRLLFCRLELRTGGDYVSWGPSTRPSAPRSGIRRKSDHPGELSSAATFAQREVHDSFARRSQDLVSRGRGTSMSCGAIDVR